MIASDIVLIISAIGLVVVQIIREIRIDRRQAVVSAKQDEVIEKVSAVAEHVNGHTTKLESQISELRLEVKSLRSTAAEKETTRAVLAAEGERILKVEIPTEAPIKIK